MTKEEFMTQYASHLNENQKKAVETVDGPVLLLAVPGSGKTTVLVMRLGYMMYVLGIDPQRILTLTYTVAATRDMAKRFATVFDPDEDRKPEFRTINGICAKIIQYYASRSHSPSFELVTDEKITGKCLSEILTARLPEYPTESDIREVRTLITYCKNMLLCDEEIREAGKKAKIPLLEIYEDYNNYLKNNRLMDYDDQMIYAYRILKKYPELLAHYRQQYQYLLVDEAQDTSRIQHFIISLLAGKDGNLFMVGDEDQSIYGFRAAYPEALLHFEEDHPGASVLVMNQNYRANASLVAAADRLIQHNTERHDKHMVPVREAGADIFYVDMKARSNQYNFLKQVAGNCKKETAVLYRDNESVLPLVDLLDRNHIPYRLRGSDINFFTSRIVTDVTNFLQLAMNPYDTELFMKVYFKCQTYLKRKQAENVCRISRARHIPVADAAEYLQDLNSMTKGKCRALSTNLKAMKNETPSRALFRIENPMEYGEYLNRNGIDSNKLSLLKSLSSQEQTITGFLSRLSYLRELLKNSVPDYSCPFILSTIHSSKGLEYEKVYMMDVYDGVLPRILPPEGPYKNEELERELEEERRLFYVGMTRAKEELCIFRFDGENSIFLRNLQQVKKTDSRKQERKRHELPEGYEPTVGDHVVQKTLGRGEIISVTPQERIGKLKFCVKFEDGTETDYLFPDAFRVWMWLEGR